ncbi:permease [Salipaludibacillus sp. HK11]|uniref:permease n=1 Tax=Salipaludibacillus sp. HK11 TaxID=3394320 RepID=UPI0039FDA505
MMTHSYTNFTTALYCTVSCLDNPLDQINEEMTFFEKHLNVSKVYIETHRGTKTLKKEKLQELKQFFQEKNIQVAGGITPTLGDEYRPGYKRLFGGICYTDQTSRKKFQKVVELTAELFDEIILDDFFFTNCRCDDCLEQKGDKTWESFRLELLEEVSSNLVVTPAKKVNPNVKLVIKYPNWNESYATSGYNTEKQPELFDGVYTGTETRDPATSQQHIPRYASFSLMTWMENLLPGKNGGGWFDRLDCTYTDYYLEQANLTVFAKAKEITLFNYSNLKDHLYTPSLGFRLDKLDQLVGKLGNPIGVKVYHPHHGKGEDHLYDYLGMSGIPFEMTPYFPVDPGSLLLTASASGDTHIIEKMKAYLKKGGNIFMTSGFIEKMDGHGVDEFTTLKPTGKKYLTKRFAIETAGCTFDDFIDSSENASFPLFEYSTNATWQTVVGWNGQNNSPIFMYDHYSKGTVFSLIVPDHFTDLWRLPRQVVTKIRETMVESFLDYSLKGPANIGFFPYDNGTFILETFEVSPEKWSIEFSGEKTLVDLKTGKNLEPDRLTTDGVKQVDIELHPFEYRGFKVR